MHGLKNLDLLLVDDDYLVHELLKLVLKNSQMSVEYFLSPLDALCYVENCFPRNIIADYRMPSMDGLQFLVGCRDFVPVELCNIYIASSAPLPENIEQQAAQHGIGLVDKSRYMEAGYIEGQCRSSVGKDQQAS